MLKRKVKFCFRRANVIDGKFWQCDLLDKKIMQIVFWYKMAVQIFRSFLGLISVFAIFIFSIAVSSQTANSGLQMKTIVKSGKFMAREHLVIDLQNGVEWMRCSVGGVWNGSCARR